jgi:hypothetical protein
VGPQPEIELEQAAERSARPSPAYANRSSRSDA